MRRLPVLTTIRYVGDRVRQPRWRADEALEVRRRLDAQPGGGDVRAELVALAIELRELRAAVLTALGQVDACRGCARGRPLPHGRWAGGFCCGGRTEELFTDDELLSLRLAGTTARDLVLPGESPSERRSADRDERAGCVFRGEAGCALSPVDRPSLCVRFLCQELRAELLGRPDATELFALTRRLGEAFTRFERLRGEVAR